jgi:hypothetical protein
VLTFFTIVIGISSIGLPILFIFNLLVNKIMTNKRRANINYTLINDVNMITSLIIGECYIRNYQEVGLKLEHHENCVHYNNKIMSQEECNSNDLCKKKLKNQKKKYIIIDNDILENNDDKIKVEDVYFPISFDKELINIRREYPTIFFIFDTFITRFCISLSALSIVVPLFTYSRMCLKNESIK